VCAHAEECHKIYEFVVFTVVWLKIYSGYDTAPLSNWFTTFQKNTMQTKQKIIYKISFNLVKNR
jgi:hypothetical protein